MSVNKKGDNKRIYRKTCGQCKQKKLDTKRREDPFAREINNESIMLDLCDECYQNRHDDI
jgi:hypothetical protein